MSIPESPTPATGRGRIVIIDGHTLFADALRVVLEREGHAAHRVLVNGHDIDTVVASVLALHPTLVVLDLDLAQGRDGMQAVTALVGGGTQVLAVTASTDVERWGEALHQGAVGVLSRTTSSLGEVLRAIARIEAGQRVVSARERHELVQRFLHAGTERAHLSSRFDRLSQREREVLAHLLAGRQVRRIAEVSTVSEATVRTQVKSVLSKLGVGSQLAAVSMAHQIGWRGPGS